jgi:succinate dehydrogenase / fumarate reductase membrane anchor subunit
MGDGTSIGRVRGLGPAHEGTHHWLLQRFTAAGNLITVVFLVVSLALMPDFQFETIQHWVARPVTTLALALMIVSVFWHARLGLQVMVEDYVHGPGSKFAATLVLNLAFFAGAGFGLLSLLRIAAGAASQSAAQAAISAAMAGAGQ